MLSTTVSGTVKRYWLFALYLLIALWWIPAAEASFKLTRDYKVQKGIPAPVTHVTGLPKLPANLIRVIRFPASVPQRVGPPAVRTSAPSGGGCHAAPGTPGQAILMRESEGNPRVYNRQGSGASGCWQFMPGTWGNYGGYANAADAPVSVQNERAKQVWAGGAGCSHWAAC